MSSQIDQKKSKLKAINETNIPFEQRKIPKNASNQQILGILSPSLIFIFSVTAFITLLVIAYISKIKGVRGDKFGIFIFPLIVIAILMAYDALRVNKRKRKKEEKPKSLSQFDSEETQTNYFLESLSSENSLLRHKALKELSHLEKTTPEQNSALQEIVEKDAKKELRELAKQIIEEQEAN